MGNFFEIMETLTKNFDLNLVFRNNGDGTMTVSVLPENFNGDDGSISPIVIKGKSEEFAIEFFPLIIKPIEEAGIKVKSVEQFQNNIDLLLKNKKEAEKKALEKKSTTKAKKPESVAQKVEEKKEDKPKELSLFH